MLYKSREDKLELMAMLAKLVGRTMEQFIKLGAPREYIRDTADIFALLTSVIADSLIPDLNPEEIQKSLENVDKKYEQFVAQSYYNKTNTNIPN
tara:strand:+ start:65 stop:346 length:282 start_codon:yes stop_codon:yes gene_type:complete